MCDMYVLRCVMPANLRLKLLCKFRSPSGDYQVDKIKCLQTQKIALTNESIKFFTPTNFCSLES